MKNWKTTLFGVLSGAAVMLEPLFTSASQGALVDWGHVGFGLALMALGIVARDFDTPSGQ